MERLIHILLYAGVATALFSTVGVLVMENLNDRLHYLGPSGTLSIALIAAAIVLQEGASQFGTKAILCALIVFVSNPVLTHATARADRVRRFGRWSEPEDQQKKAS
jgi:multicomponent Na+:H+ antiporter subunit G